MRPNPSSQKDLDEIMTEIIPESLDPETTLGLPIRGACASWFHFVGSAGSDWIVNRRVWNGFCLFVSSDPTLYLVHFLPASDKCSGESDCLSFDEHMTVTNDFWKRHLNETDASHNPTIVFTTEAKSMMAEQKAWVANKEQDERPYAFTFVTNDRDLLPDTGFIKEVCTYSILPICASFMVCL